MQSTIKQSITKKGRGKFVFLQDFSVYSSRDAVKKAFQQHSTPSTLDIRH